jgi:hypothetical protein
MSVASWFAANTNRVVEVEVWAIVANGTWAHAEHEAIVALFDSEELAQAYLIASRLPPELRGRKEPNDHIHRSFRKDSLLWEFNDSSRKDFCSANVFPLAPFAPPHIVAQLHLLPINPLPPDVNSDEAFTSRDYRHTGITLVDKYGY